MTTQPYKFLPAFKARLARVRSELADLEHSVEELLKIAPETEVSPGGVVTDYIEAANRCVAGAAALLERAQEHIDEIEARRLPAWVYL